MLDISLAVIFLPKSCAFRVESMWSFEANDAYVHKWPTSVPQQNYLPNELYNTLDPSYMNNNQKIIVD
jgi:hypothetical protein